MPEVPKDVRRASSAASGFGGWLLDGCLRMILRRAGSGHVGTSGGAPGADRALWPRALQRGTYLPQTYIIQEEMVVTEHVSDKEALGSFIYHLCNGKDTYRLRRRATRRREWPAPPTSAPAPSSTPWPSGRARLRSCWSAAARSQESPLPPAPRCEAPPVATVQACPAPHGLGISEHLENLVSPSLSLS